MSTENTPSLFSDAFVSSSAKTTETPSVLDVTTNTNLSNDTQESGFNHESYIANQLHSQLANQSNDEPNNQLRNDTKMKTTTSDFDKSKEVKQVNIVISGFNYTINCPADERDELNKAAGYINGFIRELRKDSPLLSHENLLVLCCLNLFEEMQQQKNNTASLMETDKQVRSLLEKINNDAKSIIT